MSLPLSVFTVLKIVAAVVSLALAVWVWRNRATTPGRNPFIGYMLAAACWAMASALETTSDSLGAILLWSKVLYIGSTLVPVAWLALTLEYTGRQRLLTRRNLLLLLIVPGVILAAVWTNEAHGLIWGDIGLRTDGGFLEMTFSRGPLYWVNVAYAYGLILIAFLLMIQAFVRVSGPYRFQIAALLIAALIPMAGNVMYMSSLNPWPGVDLTSVFFVSTGLIAAWALFRYRLLDIVPVARDVIVASMSDAVIVFDAQGRVVDANRAAGELLGRPASALVGRPADQVFASQADLFETYKDVVEEAYGEVTLADRANPLSFDLRLSPLRDRRGQLTGHVLALRDITERKRAEAALQTAHDWLSVLVQIDAELILSLNLDQVLTVALHAALLLSNAEAGFIALGDKDNLRMVRLSNGYPPEYTEARVPPEATTIMQALSQRQPVLQTEIEHDARRVSVLPATRARLAVPLLSHDELIGVLNLESSRVDCFSSQGLEFIKLLAARAAVAIDNAQLYESRMALIEDLDAFAHMVAHDLKNPLNSVMLSGGLLAQAYSGRVPEEVQQRAVNSVLGSAHKMAAIIDALLLLAGVRQRTDIHPGPLDMDAILKEVMPRMEGLIQFHQAEVSLPDVWPEALGYAPWVEEVFANYLSNAIKYGGEPPRIELGADSLPNGKARFWVRDQGAGLTPEEQAQLFTPFTRLSQVKADGHGLGLSIVRRIVEKLGGEAGVESAPGEGSTFWFTLPAA